MRMTKYINCVRQRVYLYQDTLNISNSSAELRIDVPHINRQDSAVF